MKFILYVLIFFPIIFIAGEKKSTFIERYQIQYGKEPDADARYRNVYNALVARGIVAPEMIKHCTYDKFTSYNEKCPMETLKKNIERRIKVIASEEGVKKDFSEVMEAFAKRELLINDNKHECKVHPYSHFETEIKKKKLNEYQVLGNEYLNTVLCRDLKKETLNIKIFEIVWLMKLFTLHNVTEISEGIVRFYEEVSWANELYPDADSLATESIVQKVGFEIKHYKKYIAALVFASLIALFGKKIWKKMIPIKSV